MGQKINPTGFRLSVSRNWTSRWYANNNDFANMLKEDVEGFVFGSDLFLLMIRQYLMSLSLSTLEVDAFHF